MKSLPVVVALCLPCLAPTDGGAGAPRRSTPPGTASVLLITIDTLRYDRAGDGGPMPRLQALARRGVVFAQARAPVPLTVPSHATLLTGRGPLAHGMRDNIGAALPSGVPTVAAAFAAAGMRTAAFVGGYPLSRRTGLNRGFEVYDDAMTRESRGRAGPSERRAEAVVSSALAWLRQDPAGRFFAWIHLYDPHDPYDPPAPFAGRHPVPYDDEVAYVDASLGPIFDWIEGAGVSSRTWIFVTSDHGESLGEHGERTHGIFLYDSTLRVPLILVPPGGCDARVDGRPVQLADVAASMIDAAGLPPLPGSEGRSLLQAAHAPAVTYIESLHAARRYGWSPLSGWIAWPTKFIDAPRPEIYDLQSDPGESVNLAVVADVADHRRRLSALRAPATVAEEVDLDVEAVARLASLGYAGGSSAPPRLEPRPDPGRPDPKDRVAALPLIDAGLVALDEGDADEAERLFQRALRIDAGNLVALNNLGILSVRRGDHERAVSYFGRGLEVSPDAEEIANDLGLALVRLGRYREAVDAYRKALDIRPGFTGARFNLAMAMHRMGRDEEALSEMERVAREDASLPGLADAIRTLRRRVSGQARQPATP